MKWLSKVATIMVGVGLLVGPAHAQNDVSKSATSETTIKKDGTSREPSAASNSTEAADGGAGHVASKVGHKIEAVTRKVGNAMKRGVQKTAHAFERAGQWIENKIRSAKQSNKNSST